MKMAHKRLGVDEMEFLSLFQRHWNGLLHWLDSHQNATNELMECTVHILVNKEDYGSSSARLDDANKDDNNGKQVSSGSDNMQLGEFTLDE